MGQENLALTFLKKALTFLKKSPPNFSKPPPSQTHLAGGQSVLLIIASSHQTKCFLQVRTKETWTNPRSVFQVLAGNLHQETGKRPLYSRRVHYYLDEFFLPASFGTLWIIANAKVIYPRKSYRHPALRESLFLYWDRRRLRRLAVLGYKITHFISILPSETEKSYEKFSNCLEIPEIMPILRSVRSNVLA